MILGSNYCFSVTTWLQYHQDSVSFFFLLCQKHQNKNIQTMSAMWRAISSEALEDLDLSSQALVFVIFEETFYCLGLSIKWISMTSARWNDWQTSQNNGCTPVKLLWGTARCRRDGFAVHTCAACNVMATECSGPRRSVTQGGIVEYQTSNVKGDGLNIKVDFCPYLQQHKTDLPLFTVSLCCGKYSWNLFMWVSWQCW